MKKALLASAVVASVTVLSACGGSSDSEPMFAKFSLGVSDAPVNGAKVVMVCFNEIELSGNGVGSQSFTIGDDDVADDGS